MMTNTAERAIAAYLAGDLDGVRAVYADLAAFVGVDMGADAPDPTISEDGPTLNASTLPDIGD